MSAYRLLGPQHNRLLTVHPSPVRELGQISHETAEELKKVGWVKYGGNAQDDNGWIIPDTDPLLKSRTTSRND